MELTNKEFKIAEAITQKLRDSGFVAYLAGGCVRDFLMNRPPTDYDIATTAQPEHVEQLFDKTVPVGKQFGVMLVLVEGITFEVATFRSEGAYLDGRHPTKVSFTTPEEDAERRDFTVNGLFFDPATRQVIDYVNGGADIEHKIIRTIGKPRERFNEDKLRLLRAIRFATNLGFQIEQNTWDVIKSMAHEIRSVSNERIRDELIKLFTRARAGDGLELLSESGLLREILPEIEAMKGVEQPPEFHPEGDVFIHTKIIMNKLETPSVVLAFGALLHDVGKPVTYSNEKGKIRFYSHSRIGAEMSQQILKRLRFSNKEIDRITSCVDNHMTFGNVKEMRIGKLKQFITRDNFPEELELHRIDCESSHGLLDNYQFLKTKLAEYEKENLKPKPIIDGHDLITLGIIPGPLMKKILDDAYLAQLEDRWQTKDEGLQWVKQKYPPQKAI